MAIGYNIHEPHIKRDGWVKDIKKTFAPNLLADLIKKRIEFPNITGPYIRNQQNETPTDIIDAFIADDEEYRNKLAPAVGLLLYKMMNNELGESHEILRGLFSVIKESKLVECHKLLNEWINLKAGILIAGDTQVDQRWKQTYRDGMMAFAQIQNSGIPEIEHWWFNVWREGSIAWWAAAFTGLRIQNPAAACKELQLLVSRNTDKTPFLLTGMWNDVNARPLLEAAIHNGLNDDAGWAGLALNMILEKLTDKFKNEIMANLKALSSPNTPILMTKKTDKVVAV